MYDYTFEYAGLFADTPQHAHASRPQILHRSGEKNPYWSVFISEMQIYMGEMIADLG